MNQPASRHLTVTRQARWSELGRGGPDAEQWIVLHGYGQLAARFAERFEVLLDSGKRQIVAPEGLSRFYLESSHQRVGASWMTRDDREREIEDTCAWLDTLVRRLEERDGPPARRVALGFSQGAPTVARWLSRSRVHADRLILWGSGLPHDVDLPRHRELFASMQLEFVLGEGDAVVPPAQMELEVRRAVAAGLPAEVIRHAGGHRIVAEVLRTLAARD